MKITDEMRDQMLFKVNVLGMTAADVGRELGISGGAVGVACRVFEAVRVKVPEALKKELAEFQQALRSKYEAPKEPAKPEPPKVAAPETAPAGPKMHIPEASAETGWQTRIKVTPDKVCMMVYFNGMEVVQGWSKVKGDKELDLMQAISYAAHMCYKIVEQRKLGGR